MEANKELKYYSSKFELALSALSVPRLVWTDAVCLVGIVQYKITASICLETYSYMCTWTLHPMTLSGNQGFKLIYRESIRDTRGLGTSLSQLSKAHDIILK